MILSDFLSRMEGNKSDLMMLFPYHLIPPSTLTEHYYTFSNLQSEIYRVVTRSQTKAVGTQMPKVHGVDKVVCPACKHKLYLEENGIP